MLEICLGYKVASYSHHTESEKWENVFFKLFILLNQIGNEIFLLNTDLWPVSSSSLLLFFTFSLLSLYPHLNFYSVFFFIFLFYFFPFPLLLILFFYATSESGFIFCFLIFAHFVAYIRSMILGYLRRHRPHISLPRRSGSGLFLFWTILSVSSFFGILILSRSDQSRNLLSQQRQ